LDAVLAHEGAHLRRRDPPVGAIARVNRCLFWFHPLAWMLERRLALLAEQACDEFCVAALGDREGYERLLVEFAQVVDRSHGRLRYHARTMAGASHIRRRIDSLLEEGRTFSRGLSC
jgi:beta-lactamase regulating signal transducer with metallopeptidase domain